MISLRHILVEACGRWGQAHQSAGTLMPAPLATLTGTGAHLGSVHVCKRCACLFWRPGA